MPDFGLCCCVCGCLGEGAFSSLMASSFCFRSSGLVVGSLEFLKVLLRLSSQLSNSSLAYSSLASGWAGAGSRGREVEWRTSESSNMESLRRASISAWFMRSPIQTTGILQMSWVGEWGAGTVGAVMAATAYAGCFLMVSNHYVLRPKVEDFLGNWARQGACRQLLIDLLTNLPALSLLVCTLLVQGSDSGLSVVVYSDLGWSGLCAGLLAFRRQQRTEAGNWKLMLAKSICLLGLVYGAIAVHYLAQGEAAILAVVLVTLYFLNLAIDSYEEKFVAAMQYLFNYRPQNLPANDYQHAHRVVTAEYLARNFPVSAEELNDKMRTYEKETRSIKLKTKSVVALKLMRVALAVHLSRQKLEAKSRRDIRNYYGTFNGTVADKSRRLILERPATRDDPNLPSLDHEDLDAPDTAPEAEQEVESCLFYIFPVRIFEKNALLSVVFSLAINVGFGVLLSVAVGASDGLAAGQYAHLFYGLLLLPLLPSASKVDYFATMSLSSLWKYCLYGLMLVLAYIVNGASPSLTPSDTLSFAAPLQLLAITLLTYMLVTVEHCSYRLLFVWAAVLFANLIFIFKFA